MLMPGTYGFEGNLTIFMALKVQLGQDKGNDQWKNKTCYNSFLKSEVNKLLIHEK